MVPPIGLKKPLFSVVPNTILGFDTVPEGNELDPAIIRKEKLLLAFAGAPAIVTVLAIPVVDPEVIGCVK